MNWLDRNKRVQSQLSIDTWKALDSLEQLQQIKRESSQKPIVIFKHSTSCGTSARAKYLLEQDWSSLMYHVDFYYLDLFAFRSVSNAVAKEFGVIHHSPQLIVIHKERVIYHTSHHMISIDALNEALSKEVEVQDKSRIPHAHSS